MMASSIPGKLPAECWLLVLEKLPSRDLLSLSKTSSNIRVSVQPLIYRSIHWDWCHPPLERALMLLRSISERPDLANYVCHLTMKDWAMEFCPRDRTCKPYGLWEKTRQQYRPTLRWIRMIIQRAKYPPKVEERWIALLDAGDECAYGTVLLLLFPNLRTLRLDYSFLIEGLPGTMLYHSVFSGVSSDILPKFERLEMVDYGSNARLLVTDDEQPLNLHHQLMPWFHLPSLKTLEIWIPGMEAISRLSGLEIDPIPSPPPLSLQRLFIGRTCASPERIGALLSKIPPLKWLHLGMVYRRSSANDTPENSHHFLGSILTKHQTLEHLSISLEERLDCLRKRGLPLNREISSEPFRGILFKLPKLKSVELPMEFLLGWGDEKYKLRDVLPPWVKLLHLRPDFWSAKKLRKFHMEVVKVVNEFVLHEDPVQSIERISFERDCRSLSNEGHLDNTPLEVLRDLVYVNCSDRWIRLACYSQYRIPGNLKRGHWALEDSLDYYTPWPFHHQELPLFVEQGYRTARKMAIICNIRHGPTATRPSS